MQKYNSSMKIPLKDKHPIIQLLAFIGIAIVSSIVITLIGLIGGILYWGDDFLQSFMQVQSGAAYISYMKYLQLISHLGMFIVPTFIYARLAGGKIASFMHLKGVGKGSGFFLAIAMIFLAQPLINLLTVWNAGMSLPESMQGLENSMRTMEDQATEMTELFLNVNSIGALLFNILLLAIIPALGEEFVFRGILQKQLQRWTKSGWAAILISAFVFSAFHMQFYGFVPRFILGILLGYVFLRSGKLWLSILIHFINNGMAVIMYYLYHNNYIAENPDELFNFNDNIPVLLISFLLLGGSIILFHLVYKKQSHE